MQEEEEYKIKKIVVEIKRNPCIYNQQRVL